MHSLWARLGISGVSFGCFGNLLDLAVPPQALTESHRRLSGQGCSREWVVPDGSLPHLPEPNTWMSLFTHTHNLLVWGFLGVCNFTVIDRLFKIKVLLLKLGYLIGHNHTSETSIENFKAYSEAQLRNSVDNVYRLISLSGNRGRI